MDTTFKGAARRLTDLDLPRLGARIGVGEDEIHAFLDVETSGHGFDAQGRPIILFEPHVFFRNLSGTARAQAVAAGLAYVRWGEKPYPRDSYPRLKAACAIDETARSDRRHGVSARFSARISRRPASSPCRPWSKP